MFNKFLKTLVKYKIFLIIGGFLVVIIVAVIIFTALAKNAKADIKIEVKPTLSLGPCFNNQVPPKTSIVSPADGTRYTTGDKVSLTGIAVLECNNTKLDEKDLSWYLDSDTTPFATGYAYSLEGLKAGDHKIKLDSVSGKLKSEVVVNINVSDPKPQVLGVKAPPPAPKVDNPPVVKLQYVNKIQYNGDSPYVVTASYVSDRTRQGYFADITLEASATDEDSQLTTQWFIDGKPFAQGLSLTNSFTVSVIGDVSPCGSYQDYPIKFTATDSKGQSSEFNFILRPQVPCAANGNNLLNLNLQLGL